MDEVLFRSGRSLENLQVQGELLAIKSKEIFSQYITQTKSIILQAWNSSKLEHLKHQLKELWIYALTVGDSLKDRFLYFANPSHLILNFSKVFGRKWTSRDLCFCCAGFLAGGLVGIVVGLSLRKNESVVRYMQAIKCNHYLGADSATVVEDAIAPYECGENEVLVNVKAGSVQVIDAQVCLGYGRNLRRILRRIFRQSNSDLPIVLGRDCSGIISDLGCNVKRLEVGDDVWLTVPFWSQGSLSQNVLVDQNRVSKKPKNIGFEGACSLPYAGCLALAALNKANLNVKNAQDKKILIQGGCTPVGCVLIQILKFWNANITATCYKRATPVAKALGATDIIILSDDNENESERLLPNALFKELEVRNTLYDVIINTKECSLTEKQLQLFCTKDGVMVTSLPPKLASDSNGFFGNIALGGYIRMRYYIMKLFGVTMDDFDESHLCHETLDQLSNLVELGYLQTVVDKVFHPQDIEMALAHIQSPISIGSTVITFR
ncbi:unnamed protein product [Brassicogethes aeneus]|uniref:Enoyl reductase (ER) domain-containing protein n=1 Tax=Brassicogethes aeneus TaxID=1431903 RepID=A0A9P0AWC4_BRAAE|nr:unnamed protein product [Brassicogethes aeneus]